VRDEKAKTKADAKHALLPDRLHRRSPQPFTETIFLDNFIEADTLDEVLGMPRRVAPMAGVPPTDAGAAVTPPVSGGDGVSTAAAARRGRRSGAPGSGGSPRRAPRYHGNRRRRAGRRWRDRRCRHRKWKARRAAVPWPVGATRFADADAGGVVLAALLLRSRPERRRATAR